MPAWDQLPASVAVASKDPLVSDQQTRLDDLPMPLGFALGAGWPLLLSQLDSTAGKEPIVFIGEFPIEQQPGAAKDIHTTFRGSFRGGHLLMALFNELGNDAHVLKGWMLAFEFILFAGLSFLVFRKAWSPLVPKPGGARSSGTGFNDVPKSTASVAVEPGSWALFLRYVKKTAVSQWPLLLFLFVFLVIDLAFRQHSNLAAPFAYFLTLNALFGQLHKVRQDAMTPAVR